VPYTHHFISLQCSQQYKFSNKENILNNFKINTAFFAVAFLAGEFFLKFIRKKVSWPPAA